jgi:hypothetical protein
MLHTQLDQALKFIGNLESGHKILFFKIGRAFIPLWADFPSSFLLLDVYRPEFLYG